MSGIAIGGGGGGGFNPQPPTNTVTGSGSYTIPAGKYGHISMTTSASMRIQVGQRLADNVSFIGNGNASSNSASQWIVAGASISTNSATGSNNASVGVNVDIQRAGTATANVRIDGADACTAIASGYLQGLSGGGGSAGVTGNVNTAWTVSLFDV